MLSHVRATGSAAVLGRQRALTRMDARMTPRMGALVTVSWGMRLTTCDSPTTWGRWAN